MERPESSFTEKTTGVGAEYVDYSAIGGKHTFRYDLVWREIGNIAPTV